MVPLLRSVLTRARSGIDRPLRAEPLSKDLLAQRATELAQYHSQVRIGGRGAKLRSRFRENCRLLNDAYFSFSEASRNKEPLAAGAEWLLDNFHVIDEQVRDIRRDLPWSYYRALPKVASGDWKGFPRVYQIVCDFISHTDAIVETDSLTTFIDAYQSRSVLLIGEIWAVPIMLRLALVENLRRLAASGLFVSENRRTAEELCREVVDLPGLGGAELLMQMVERVNRDPDVLVHGAAQIMRRLRAKGNPAALSLQWVDEQLRERGIDPNEVARIEQQSQAADQLSVGNSVMALKTIGSLNWREWFERVSPVDHILNGDPARIYMGCDFLTRDRYRHRIEKLARRTGLPEVEVAARVVAIADERLKQLEADGTADRRSAHVGWYLVDDGLVDFERSLGIEYHPRSKLREWVKRYMLTLYLGAIWGVVALGIVIALVYSVCHQASWPWLLACIVILSLPLSDFAVHLVHWIATKFVAPKPLPKMNYEKGIPEHAKTAIVVQSIFSDREALDRAVELLKIRAIGNMDDQFVFGILADFADAPTDHLPGDQGILRRARELVDELNSHFHDGVAESRRDRFFILFRSRQWNASEGRFMGWERKRGKVMEFNRLLRGATDTSFVHHFGCENRLADIRYVITLDNDSQLPPGVARKLVGTIDHPLNHARFDDDKRTVVKGYGIIQPRVGITLQSANASNFAVVFSGHTGLDPYTLTVSDVYQDLFGEGSYIGKGIYDVDTFERALHDRFPENTLLSHDLVEGTFARSGLASDIEVYDDFPMRYHAQSRRQHRWMRGDWQLLPYVGGHIPNSVRRRYRTPLSGLSRWKLLDNFRRSLVPVFWLLTLVASWVAAPGDWRVWHGAFALLLGFPVLMVMYRMIFDIPFGYSLTTFAWSLWEDIRKNTLIVFFHLVFLPHSVANALHAIFVTLYRVLISKKDLLEWETAAVTERRLAGSLNDFLRSMWPAWVPTAIIGVLLASSHLNVPSGIPVVFMLMWILSPVAGWWLSQPRRTRNLDLSSADRDYLRSIAFSTWQYFDTFLVPEYHYLVPDNLQIVPNRVVAERTSPTNISLSLLSVLSAYDLGFIPLPSAVTRITNTVTTLGQLEKFHGHFLNWYEIRGLKPLPPRYISTVDSGNLVGHFIALRQALDQFPHLPLFTADHLGLIARLLKAHGKGVQAGEVEQIAARPSGLRQVNDVLQVLVRIREQLGNDAPAELVRVIDAYVPLRDFISWTDELGILRQLGERGLLSKKLKEIDGILDGRAPTSSLVLKIINRLLRGEHQVDRNTLTPDEREQFTRLIESLETAQRKITELHENISTLIEQIGTIIREMDFKFLFDQQKKLFIIGYNIDNGQRDNSFYDLLASEARLASFMAIAKGDLPQTHWFLLNRALTDSPGGKALISWGGTMFEYLMPLLVMQDYEQTLLAETYRAVVKAQRLYAQRRAIPWGISESAYSGVDFEKTYQYRAFGIPGLGLKRGLAEDLVVSPYSTAMAIPIDISHALTNLRRLEADGVRGEYGFYEAVDYTAERLASDERCHIVRSFLAHHQGMSLIAMTNALKNGIFQRRFHSDPIVRANELLLQERFPRRIPVILPHQAEVLSLKPMDSEGRAESAEIIRTPHTRYPLTRLLSNSKLSIVVDNSGNTLSLFQGDLALTRWREDGVSGGFGTFLYVRDAESGEAWSAAYQPMRVEPEQYEAVFNLDKVEYRRTDHGIRLKTEVTISPEDNVEVRRIQLTNISSRRRELEVTSYGEVALAAWRADLAHPAFSKMFVESEYLEDYDALLFTRRKRSDHDRELFLVHLVTMSIVWAPTEYETDRELFLGRGGSPWEPRAMTDRGRLSGSVGTVLDPIFALRNRVEIELGESQTISFVTGIAETKDEALQLIRKYREGQYVTRAFEMAWSHSDVEVRHQHITRASVNEFQRLANALVYNIEAVRAPSDVIKRCTLSQSALWRFGVSGDEAIVLLIITDPDQTRLCQELLFAHEYLRLRGIRFDLVILNEYQSGYLQDLQHELEFLVRTGFSRNLVDQRGGVFLRSLHQISEEEITLLQAVARVVIWGNRGALGNQLQFGSKPGHEAWPRRPEVRSTVKRPRRASSERAYFNGIGGFSTDGRSYQMRVSADRLPPLPWSNVIANRRFGFLVTETGAGFTWSENSRENRMTPWSNDPVSDPHGEVVYLRDQESGELWSPTPLPVRHGEEIDVEHGFGYSRFAGTVNGVESDLVISGDPEDPLKWWYLELSSSDGRPRRLEVYLYVDWVLGVSRHESYRNVRTAFDSEKQILYATNPFHMEFSSQVAFIGSNYSIQSYTGSRSEFIGRNRDLGSPVLFESGSLGSRIKGRHHSIALSGNVGAGWDPCGAIKIQLDIVPGEKHHVLFYLGRAESLAEAKDRSTKARLINTRNVAFKATEKFWNGVTSAVQVRTPSRKFDTLANGWLQYQTLGCRMFARSGYYQSSGALGFRDQLQDSLAMLYSRPDITRDQIALHAAHQFVEGDVQHWWHPPSGRGIRSRISDNYLWLPFAVLEYLDVTGSDDLLNTVVPFIEGPQLEPHVHDSYFTPQVSSKQGSLYEHCAAALDRATERGVHGLPLMGGGDWNDGMNTVGIEGKGESVWLAWFQAHLFERFAVVAERRGDLTRATEYRSRSAALVSAIENNAWDGAWYRRAYFDDGTPLGTAESAECQIDSLAQSWGVITHLSRAERQREGMEQVYARLVDREHSLIRLLWPPFAHHRPNPGYIQSYPPGLRENGGQYTHAATWVIMAQAMLGDGARAVELFDLVNPISHTETEEQIARYKTEPYVLCGDVYANPRHVGRGGWSWYTGSSGWLYRVAVEHICGVKIRGTQLTVAPVIPDDWREMHVDIRHGDAFFRVHIQNEGRGGRGGGVPRSVVKIGGETIPDGIIDTTKYQGEVKVEIVLEASM